MLCYVGPSTQLSRNRRRSSSILTMFQSLTSDYFLTSSTIMLDTRQFHSSFNAGEQQKVSLMQHSQLFSPSFSSNDTFSIAYRRAEGPIRYFHNNWLDQVHASGPGFTKGMEES